MNAAERIYAFLCVLFAGVILLGNLTYQKFVFLPLGIHTFELSVGALLYPFTFLITDLITEFFNKEKARFCVLSAIILNGFTLLVIMSMDALPATAWSTVNDHTFHHVFGFYPIAFASSLLASYTAQRVDIALYSFFKKITRARFLWLRMNLSTAVALLVDTSLVVGLMALAGVLPSEQALNLIVNSYMFKIVLTLLSTPVFYGCVIALRRALSRDPCK